MQCWCVQALLCIEENMFDISEYTVGVICGELLEVIAHLICLQLCHFRTSLTNLCIESDAPHVGLDDDFIE